MIGEEKSKIEIVKATVEEKSKIEILKATVDAKNKNIKTDLKWQGRRRARSRF